MIGKRAKLRLHTTKEATLTLTTCLPDENDSSDELEYNIEFLLTLLRCGCGQVCNTVMWDFLREYVVHVEIVGEGSVTTIAIIIPFIRHLIPNRNVAAQLKFFVLLRHETPGVKPCGELGSDGRLANDRMKEVDEKNQLWSNCLPNLPVELQSQDYHQLAAAYTSPCI